MKIAIIFGLFAAASAGVVPFGHHGALLAAPAHHAAIVNTGTSAQFRSQDNIGNYAFGYNEDHSTGGTFRREQGDAHGNKVGSYGLRDADGRLRIVNYVADEGGFRANIQTNEPGVEPKDPAATVINKPGLVAAPIHAEPAHYAPAHIAAPVAHHGALLAAPAHHGGLVAAPAHHGALVAPAHHGYAPAHHGYAAPIAYSAAYQHALGFPAAYHF
jgi:hypothetical protein